MPGRPKKPILLHKIHGTGIKSRLLKRAGELQVSADKPEAPAWLTEEALAEWNRLMMCSDYAAVLTQIDRGMLAYWCQEWGQYERSQMGLCDRPNGRDVSNMIQVGRLIGSNPQDRCKIKTPDKPTEKSDDRWAVFG